MSYSEAMEAAGAEVLEYESFGSYQGDWWALVRYQGQVGWVSGDFGSCSGCDAFDAEFSWGEADPDKLAAFGRGYLDALLTPDDAVTQASRHIKWDHEAESMVEWIKASCVKHGLLLSSVAAGGAS